MASALPDGVKRGKDGKLDEPIVHACGKSFTYAQSYVAHAKKCDGTAPATVSPRAKPASERRLSDRPKTKAPTQPRKKKKRDYKAERERRRQNALTRSRPKAGSSFSTSGDVAKQAPAVSPRQIIASCDRELDRLQSEIAKVTALKTAAAAFA